MRTCSWLSGEVANAQESSRVIGRPPGCPYDLCAHDVVMERPRPSDLHCAHISKSDALDNTCAKINAFWHKRLQCQSSQRCASAVAGSGRAADAGGRRLQRL